MKLIKSFLVFLLACLLLVFLARQESIVRRQLTWEEIQNSADLIITGGIFVLFFYHYTFKKRK